MKPRIKRIAAHYYECWFIPEGQKFIRVGSGITAYEAWLYAVWGNE